MACFVKKPVCLHAHYRERQGLMGENYPNPGFFMLYTVHATHELNSIQPFHYHKAL